MPGDQVPLKLSDLEPSWVRLTDSGFELVPEASTAQGVMFLCPECYRRNSGPVGTHIVVCWFRDRGVPGEATPGPGRWHASGNSLDDLTLSPSISVPGCWHGFIRSGTIE